MRITGWTPAMATRFLHGSSARAIDLDAPGATFGQTAKPGGCRNSAQQMWEQGRGEGVEFPGTLAPGFEFKHRESLTEGASKHRPLR